ncbi:M56 family metallopeptidase [Actinomadura viridis]|uniref:Zn-dependent protease with chaperone function n=1 Tax=Actinomadura viridis TaxID=58110 RepID=A0A931GS94_9ACTN|nr:M56 family metallopeptidase [Actinomadura viridis]MBG6090574.1 Zn-dependent protease with chaperone function [Actinomadura viridis]
MLMLLIILVAALVLLGCLAGPLLDRLRPSGAHPATALWCWLGALAGTFIAAAGTISISLLWPPTPGHGFVEWLRGCLPHHPTAAMVLAGLAGLPLAWLCAARLARGVPRLRRALRHRRDHREMLHMVAREDAEHPDVLLLDHPVPVAYCLPSRWRPIVLSTGAREALTDGELQAVLEHERAHLRQRHHALLLLLDAGHALLPWLPTVRRARARVPVLLELAADDAAVRTAGSRTLAGALRRMAATPRFAGALGASGREPGTLEWRLARLEGAARRPRRLGRPVAWTLSACATALPLLATVTALGRLVVAC